MTRGRKILAWVAFVGSLVMCFPSACCFGFYAFGSFMASTLSPEKLASFSGSGDAPGPEFYRTAIVPLGFGALVALVVGIICLIWGVRTLMRNRPERGEPAVA